MMAGNSYNSSNGKNLACQKTNIFYAPAHIYRLLLSVFNASIIVICLFLCITRMT